MNLPSTLTRSVAMVALLLVSSVSLAQVNFAASRISDNLFQIVGPSGNTLVAVDTDGLLLIEGVPSGYAGEYLDFVRELTGEQRINLLVHTHWHADSAGLNQILGDAGVEIVAHANTRQWLGATIRRRGEQILHEPLTGDALPKTYFYSDYSIPFRGGNIELGYLLQAHTDGDIYVRFPQQNILYTGPVVRSDGWSTVDETTNGFIGGLTDAYDTLTALIDPETLVVPASGPNLDQQAFEEQRALYQGLKDEMVSLFRSAKSAEEVVMANPASGLRPQWGDPSEFLDQGFRSFYGHMRDSRHVGQMY